MVRSTSVALLLAAFLSAFSGACAAATLYGVTLRNRSDAVSGGTAGEIYEIDAASGASRRLATLSLNGRPVELRGLAVHPRTGVFYGITAGPTPDLSRQLVAIDPRTGLAAMVGPLGMDASDINFDLGGRLYVWLPGKNALGIVDLGTGRVTADASSGLDETVGGGFAIRSGRVALVSATSATGTLDTVDLANGRVTTGPRLVGAPFVTAITAMDFSPEGRLFAVNTNLGEPSKARLITVDPDSGRVTDVGSLPDDMTALAFAADHDVRANVVVGGMTAQELAWAAVMAVIGAIFGFLAGNRALRRS